MIKKIGQLANSVRGLIWVAFTVAPTALTFIAGRLENLPWSQRIPLVTGALAGGATLAFFVLRGYELVTGWYGTRLEGARLARELDELAGVGTKEIRISHATDLWVGGSNNVYHKIVCLRRIKQAAELGLVKFTNGIGGKPSKDSMADVKDLAKFFRERAWTKLPSLPPQDVPPPKAVVRRSRTNWVTGWRR